MDHDEITYLRENSPAWRLLRADHAPLVLAVLGSIFVVDNVRTIAESDLLPRVDELLYAANATSPPESPRYPRTARAYVQAWAAPEAGWLRAFYPESSREAHYDATADLEKAWAWVAGLRRRTFVGTESRLHTVIDLLRQIVHGAAADAGGRLGELHRRRAEIDAEIAAIQSGADVSLDGAAILDRYQHFSSTARELLADFREVEDNFRRLDRGAREKITAWDGPKGELLGELVGDRQTIAASDQGRSFQAFYDFLLSPERQRELDTLLHELADLDGLPRDRRLRYIHHDWLDAAERTQQMVRQLSEQLRRFLDDAVWLENRRVIELLRGIERTALAIRPQGDVRDLVELDAQAPTLVLPFERPLYEGAPTAAIESAPPTPDSTDVDVAVLFAQEYVDAARLAGTVRAMLRGRDQVALTDLLAAHPPELGVAEIVGYLALDEDDFDVVMDDRHRVRVPVTDAEGARRLVTMPQVTLARHTHSRGRHD